MYYESIFNIMLVGSRKPEAGEVGSQKSETLFGPGPLTSVFGLRSSDF
jgi:hypothetical protein